jgi:hypothetical protein
VPSPPKVHNVAFLQHFRDHLFERDERSDDVGPAQGGPAADQVRDVGHGVFAPFGKPWVIHLLFAFVERILLFNDLEKDWILLYFITQTGYI